MGETGLNGGADRLAATVLLTGARGFVGRAAAARLAADGYSLRRAVRRQAADGETAVGDIGPDTDWRPLVAGCDAVVHLAARVHVMNDPAADPLAEFRRTNTAATLNLARQAAAAGVRRFVFMSSIKVQGESGVFSEADPPSPGDPYARSKWEAEQGLQALAAESGMELAVLRPPLVYGPGVGANFLRLLRAVDRGLPMPFGAIANRRSLIYLGNLVDALALCVRHAGIRRSAYLVSDGEAVSTPELVRRIAAALGVPPRLLPVPPALMRLAGRLTGKAPEVARLLGSLALDDGAIRRDLGWAPPFSLDDGLAATAAWYRRQTPC